MWGDPQFWTSLLCMLGLGGYQAFLQRKANKLQEKIMKGEAPEPKTIVIKSGYHWSVMLVLMAVCWIPYFLGPKCPIEYFLQWSSTQNGGVAIQIDTSQLVSRRDRRLMAVSLVIDPLKDEMDDTRIAKSRTYEIVPPAMELDVQPTKEFLAREAEGGNIHTYLIDVPRDFALERVVKLADVESLGGKILGHKGYVGKLVLPTTLN